MIRVLHVIDSLDLGGAQTALLNLLKYADRSRFHHEVAAMHGEGMFAAAFREIGVPVHSLSAHRFPPGYLVKLPALLRSGRFDIAQFHLFGSNWISKPLAALCGVRCRYHHDQCNDAFRADSKLATKIDMLTNRLSTRVLAVSRSIERFNREVEKIPAERITFLPNSVDLEMFSPASAGSCRAAREKFDLPFEAFVIGGVGRHTPQKNFGLLLSAVERVSAGNIAVVLFGSGPEEETLRRQAASIKIPVHFAGTVENRAAIYHAIDALVLPSRFEGLPMTVLEAMAAEIPVIASAVDGVREIATHERNALLTEPGDAGVLASAIERIIADADLRRAIALAGRQLVETSFDACRLAKDLEQLYERDLSGMRR